MLLESKGTPDILLSIINKYESLIVDSSKKLNSMSIYINKPYLIANLTINFKRDENKNNFSGDLNFDDCINSNFKNCIINLNVAYFNKSLIFKSLMHELTHLYELYQIKDIYTKSKWNRMKVLSDTRKQIDNNSLFYFIDIFYLSLPFEVNARVSSVYTYLSDTKIKDIQNLKKILVETTEWRNILNLRNFAYKQLYKDLINIYVDDKVFLYKIFNVFNSKMEIKTKINSDIELYNYLKKSSRYFKSVSSNFRKKLEKVLNRVSTESLKEGYWTCETKLVNYEDYIKENEKEENKNIDYLMFL